MLTGVTVPNVRSDLGTVRRFRRWVVGLIWPFHCPVFEHLAEHRTLARVFIALAAWRPSQRPCRVNRRAQSGLRGFGAPSYLAI
jgi:hypothetical protein